MTGDGLLEAVAAHLECYRPFPEEREDVAGVVGLLHRHDAADRDAFDPGHLTASGFVLSPQLDAVALIWHRSVRAWIQPGGHIDATDPGPIEAAAREVSEETGLSDLDPVAGLFDVDVHQVPGRGGDPAHLHFDLRYLFVSRTRELVPADEVGGARWQPLSAPPSADLARPTAKLRRWVRDRTPLR